MKITKRQLRRIIKEESGRLLQEMVPSEPGGKGVESDAVDMLNDILDDWDNDPSMSGRMDYFNRIVGVTKLLERY